MQPLLALPCEYGITVQRGTRIKRVQFGDGYEQISPELLNDDIRSYRIDTAPIPDAKAIALDKQLSDLKGDFFYSQFYMDDKPYKYRLEPNQWQWSIIGPNANVFSMVVRRIYDTRA